MDALAKFLELLKGNKTAQCGIILIAVAFIAVIGLAVYQDHEVRIGSFIIIPKSSAPPEKPLVAIEPKSVPSEPSKPAPIPIPERSFKCQIGDKLHIYRDAQFPVAAGLPSGSNIYILNQDNSKLIANESVPLPDGVQRIEHLTFTVSFEYHADTTDSPASLEFVLKDADEQQIWRGTHDFRPKGPTNQQESAEVPFDIGKEYTGNKITVQIKPINAGDFGFYIYSIDGVLAVQTK